jgi:hypothetical protein
MKSELSAQSTGQTVKQKTDRGRVAETVARAPEVVAQPDRVEPKPAVIQTMNTKIWYMYRDADNYKTDNEVIVQGELSWADIQPFLVEEGVGFIPFDVGLRDLQEDFPQPGDDGIWHEIDESAIELTDKPPTVRITAQELRENFRRVGGKWDEAGAVKRHGLSNEDGRDRYSTGYDFETHRLAADVGLRACEVGYLEDGNFDEADECTRSDRVDEYLPLVEEWFDGRRAFQPVGQAGRWTYFLMGLERRWVAARIGGLPDGWIEVLSDEIRSARDEAAADVVSWCTQEGITMNTSAEVLCSSDPLVKRPTSGGAVFK